MAATLHNFHVKRLEGNDVLIFQKLIYLFIEVFEDEQTVPSHTHLSQLLKKQDFIVYVVIHNDEMVGGLTAYELVKYYSTTSEMLIYDIAIKPEFQRRGLGEKLLKAIVKHCDETGIKEVLVQAHAEDQHAIDFYKKTGGKAERVVNFIYYPSEKKKILTLR